MFVYVYVRIAKTQSRRCLMTVSFNNGIVKKFIVTKYRCLSLILTWIYYITNIGYFTYTYNK